MDQTCLRFLLTHLMNSRALSTLRWNRSLFTATATSQLSFASTIRW